MTENIQLTEGFFQEFAEDPTFAETQPILQILQSRLQGNSTAISYRLRLSDGTFTYAHCGFDKALEERVTQEELGANATFPIIKVLSYTNFLNNNKNSMLVKDYEVLSPNEPKIGNPVSHTGDAETFRGQRVAKRKLEEVVPDTKPVVMGTPAKLVKAENGGPVMPMSAITPYISGRWRIGGVVTSLEQMREINTKKGPMHVFSFILTDKDGNSIKITAFAEQATKFQPMVKENNSYFVSGNNYSIKAANKRFNATGHDYEITLNNDSTVEESAEATPNTPIRFKIRKVTLDKLSQHAGQAVDILAVIDKVEEPVSVKTKDNRDVLRRNIQLIDQSATSISLTIWAEQALNFTHDEGRVIGIKGAYIREYNGTYSLSLGSGCRMEVDPDSADTRQLLEWYENERPNAEVKSISTQGGGNSSSGDEFRLYASFYNPLALPDKGVFFSSHAMISGIRSENAIYTACPEPNCSKKVTESEGHYRCEKCCKHFQTYKNRYMVSVELTDACSSTWITLFDDKAVTLFGKTADEMAELRTSNPDEYKAVFTAKQFSTHLFRCRAKNDNYNDIPRTRITCFEMRPTNYVQYGAALDAAIKCLEEADF